MHISCFVLFVHCLSIISQKNIEIDSREEAEFLKSKLCDLLKEFMAKKSDNIEVSVTHKVKYYHVRPILIVNLLNKK